MKKSKKEKNMREFVDTLHCFRKSPKLIYCFIRTQYLTECKNYPYNKASALAKREWDRLIEEVESRKRYD